MKKNNKSTQNLAICFLICMLFAAIYPLRVYGDSERDSRLENLLDGWHYKPYCGLYCFYIFTRANNSRISFKDLVKKEYVTPKGSTLGDLLKAAEDYGFYGMVLKNLTINDLRRSPYFMILHVKNDLEAKEYNHFELFVGDQDYKARITNPPFSIRTTSYGQLSPLWGGEALILSKEPINNLAFINKARGYGLLIWGSIGLAIVLIIRYISRRFSYSKMQIPGGAVVLSIGQSAGFGLLALFIGIGYHTNNDSGFLVNSEAVSAIQRSYANTFIPKISIDTTRKKLKNGSVFIDARLSSDFQHGHLEGAINVPVNSTDEERRVVTSNIDKNASIVAYCQSSSCKYAETVSLKLQEDGFTNISIYKDGWVGWTKKYSNTIK